MTIQELATEIADPASPHKAEYDAALAIGSDQGVADALNLPRAYQSWRSRIPRAEVTSKVDWTEVVALTTNSALAFNNIMMQEYFDASIDNNRQAFATIFGPTSDTTTDLLAIARINNASRAQFLWGDRTYVTASQVAQSQGRV